MKKTVPCRLCGLPAPAATVKADKNPPDAFCCNGCSMVYTMLMESGLCQDGTDFTKTTLYKECVATGVIPDPALHNSGRQDKQSGKIPFKEDFSHDDTSLKATDAPDLGPADSDNLLDVRFHLRNMWCPACAWIVQKALQGRDGVISASCNFSSDRGKVRYDPVRISPDTIYKTVEKLGYRAEPLDTGRKGKTAAFVRLFVTLFLTMNVMMLSWAVYSGFFTKLSQISVKMIAWPAFLMTTVVVFYGGYPIHWRAVTGIRTLRPGMETLITAGAFTTYFYSLFNLLKGSLHLYFDAAAMLILLILIGKGLEQSAKDRIAQGLSDFFSLVPRKVRIITEQFPKGRYVSIEQLCKNDIFGAQQEEIVAADGIVIQGNAVVDESSITGEAKPVSVGLHDKVKSGSRIVSGAIQASALAVGDESILGRMLAVMETGLAGKTARTERFESLLKFFVPVVIGLSGLTFLFWKMAGLPPYECFSRAVSVMVISCPCALGIAIPLAVVAGISKAGKQGILVRDSEAFDNTRHIDTIVFDKTGTLTTGKMKILKIEVANGFSEERILQVAAAMEKGCDHYIAHTIRNHCTAPDGLSSELENLTVHANGVSCTWEGKTLRLGSRDFVNLSNDLKGQQAVSDVPPPAQVISTVFLTVDDKLRGVIYLGDTLRKGMESMIATLHKNGFTIVLVSGDAPAPTLEAGAITGIQPAYIRGGLLPHEKAAFVTGLAESGRKTAMVGDGVNDAPAMAASNLAIAVHSGLNPGEGVAAITLMQENPVQLLDFLSLAKQVNRKVRQNLLFALVYNIIAMPVAAAGFLNPIVAVCAMLMSSLSVTFNTLLLVGRDKSSPVT